MKDQENLNSSKKVWQILKVTFYKGTSAQSSGKGILFQLGTPQYKYQYQLFSLSHVVFLFYVFSLHFYETVIFGLDKNVTLYNTILSLSAIELCHIVQDCEKILLMFNMYTIFLFSFEGTIFIKVSVLIYYVDFYYLRSNLYN